MREENSQQQQKEYYTNKRLVKPGTLLRTAAKNHTLCSTVLLQYAITYSMYLESHIQYKNMLSAPSYGVGFLPSSIADNQISS